VRLFVVSPSHFGKQQAHDGRAQPCALAPINSAFGFSHHYSSLRPRQGFGGDRGALTDAPFHSDPYRKSLNCSGKSVRVDRGE
jgi:hypothetical protein